MQGSELITKFELQTDDSTELSSAEEYDLLNKIYRQVLAHRRWKFLRTTHTGTISGTDLALPSDFDELSDNFNFADGSDYGFGAYVFVGANRQPYKIIGINERNRYRNSTAHCYLDLKNDKIVFLNAPSETSAEFDYIYVPDDITSTTSPVFPARFHDMLYHGMTVDDFIIQQSPKAKSYASENKTKYENWLRLMSIWDSKQL